MDRRLELHQILVDALGSPQVYYQSPGKDRMQYPAIVYRLSGVDIEYADNQPYFNRRVYEVSLIDPDPENPVLEKLLALQTTRFVRSYSVSGLNHHVVEVTY